MKINFTTRLASFFICLIFISFPAACDVKSFGIHVGEGPEKKGGQNEFTPGQRRGCQWIKG